MKKVIFMLPLLLIGFSAQGRELLGGTPEQQASCRPDVRRFCYKIHEDAGDSAFLACLQAHRARLSRKCRTMLESHGQ